MLKQVNHNLTEKDLVKIANCLEFYSASDISHLVKEAAMEPLRNFSSNQVMNMSKYEIRSISHKDFEAAKKTVLPSLTKKDVIFYEEWEKKFSN